MFFIKSDSLILRSRRLGEADEMATFFSPSFGKIRGIVRGAKRLRGRGWQPVEPLLRLNIEAAGKDRWGVFVISSCEVTDRFELIRKDLKKIALALYIIEITDLLTAEGQSQPSLYNLLLDALRIIGRTSKHDLILIGLEIGYLKLLGYAPQLSNCVNCGAVEAGGKFLFSSQQGGVLCGACSRNQPSLLRPAPGTLNLMRKMLKASDLNSTLKLGISRDAAREAQELLFSCLEPHLSREPMSYKFIKTPSPSEAYEYFHGR